MAKYVFGIDLGTTYSCIAYIDETGRETVIKNKEGFPTTPSVVEFESSTQVVVGKVAKENAFINPQNIAMLVKPLMGKSDHVGTYHGEDKSPEEVSSYVLRKLADDAAEILSTEVKDVVITCPAYFGTAERTATKNAGEIAGLNVLEVISEPTAAAIFYGCTKEHDEKTILVYDLGGGTFDVTIMAISADKIEIICSDGNHELGGKDWDEAVMRYLYDEFVSQTNFEGDFDESDKQALRLKAESAKQHLTSRNETRVAVDSSGLRASIILSRETFDELTSMLLNETIEKTDAAIAIAKNKGYTVDEIVLVGGSTRMKQVPEALVKKYGMEPKTDLDPDEAVAKGAAIHAVNVYIKNQASMQSWAESGESGKPEGTNLNPDDYKEELAVSPAMIGIGGKVRDNIPATTKSYALEVIVEGEPKCCNMIIKNNPMPNGSVSVSRTFGTASNNQDTAELVVFENDFMDEYFAVDEDYKLGDASLALPGNLPAGAPIEVTFELNTEGILEIYGRDVTSGKEVRATMKVKDNPMSAEKVEELKEKSKRIAVM